MAREDAVVPIDQRWICPSKFRYRCRNLIDLPIAVSAGIAFVGLQPVDRPQFDLDIDIRRDALDSFRHALSIAVWSFSRQQTILPKI